MLFLAMYNSSSVRLSSEILELMFSFKSAVFSKKLSISFLSLLSVVMLVLYFLEADRETIPPIIKPINSAKKNA